jgi:hypothetical protein
MKEYFELLDISEQATIPEIKKAYRKKAKAYHPDVNKSEEASSRFIAITHAYDQLIDFKEGRISNNYHAFQTDNYESERRRKAREYAQKRYEEIDKQNEWFEKLSIHKIFWGKTVSVLLILFSSFVLLDDFMEPVSSVNQIISLDPIRPDDYSSLILTTDKRAVITQNHPFEYVTPFEDSIVFLETPFLNFLKSYKIKNEGNYYIFTPNNIAARYSLFLYLITILSLASLIVKFEKLEPKLWIKFLTIIFLLSYLFYLANSQR